MKTLCIYHGNCDDGFGAAYAVWKKFGAEVEYYPAMHGQSPPDVTDRDVIMVDFSYKRPVLLPMLAQCKSMLILDHHKTAEADLSSIEDPKLTVVFDMERSGSIITWDHFHSKETRPQLLMYVQDHDLWIKKLNYTDAVSVALRSYPQEFGLWDTLDVHALATEGTHIQRYYRTIVDEMKTKASMFVWKGHTVPVVNAPYFMASDVAGELSEGHPFAATYSVEADGSITYSLRSREDGIDVSEIAKSYGGGGHFHAAGCQVPLMVHNDIVGKSV